MQKTPFLLLSLLLLAGLTAAVGAGAEPTITPEADLRVRQEIFDGVLYFAPDPDRNQVRFRTRVGLSLQDSLDTFKLLLANEHRRYLHPEDVEFDWDEVIIDQLYWDHQGGSARWTLGRQNIIWDDGFLMLEGKPLDGSRSIFHDALRLRTRAAGGRVDAAVIYNLKRDPVVLVGDEDRPLRDADEMGLAARLEQGPLVTSYIFKREDDPDEVLPDRTTHTFSSRREGGHSQGLWWMYEVAGQYGRWSRAGGNSGSGWSLALQARMEFPFGDTSRSEVGYFSYGNEFRTPWGRWPLWSELYIYTLIGESTPGRVHVAAWEDIAAPFLGLRRDISPSVKGKARLYWLQTAGWDPRGLLLQTRLDFKLGSHASGHLLWEMLDPGNFHDALSEAELGTQHFLRWEIILKI
jgi:hypothetical protein